MKMIEAIVKPFQVEAVKANLNQVGIRGITHSEVPGFGRRKDHTRQYRGAEIPTDYIPKVMIQAASPDSRADAIISDIQRSARTGEIGGGKILVHALDRVIRIRTGERGDTAT